MGDVVGFKPSVGPARLDGDDLMPAKLDTNIGQIASKVARALVRITAREESARLSLPLLIRAARWWALRFPGCETGFWFQTGAARAERLG
jgi:hypothetical protein